MKNADFHGSTQDIHTISTEMPVFRPFIHIPADGILSKVLCFIHR